MSQVDLFGEDSGEDDRKARSTLDCLVMIYRAISRVTEGTIVAVDDHQLELSQFQFRVEQAPPVLGLHSPVSRAYDDGKPTNMPLWHAARRSPRAMWVTPCRCCRR